MDPLKKQIAVIFQVDLREGPDGVAARTRVLRLPELKQALHRGFVLQTPEGSGGRSLDAVFAIAERGHEHVTVLVISVEPEQVSAPFADHL